ncbi:NUDIX domain-containing protein [Siccirubricoccus sp. KC 17139]|uniref:NUDIX domain-containing protein n=1 Tax=Siccirubricoccus soli TaxID=2899147 RepID=A0ABT1DCZ7_9PROT|nr:NUDIX domain-containing protein [Siccirubricoccus soli]MCO6418815.1 NUDIX domain-containing protein [Siccirubricoccus soli]MCP2684950.1 NUDIX domain-containing protein [Siccirubricoccus soli]
MDPFSRHIANCNNGHDLSGLLPFRIGTAQVGYVAPDLAEALPPGLQDAAGVTLPGGDAQLDRLVTELAAQGRFRLRGEAFDVRETCTGPVLATLDRGAVPAFGVIGQGVHLNGLVRGKEGLRIWVGIRSRHKPVAPGQLDNLVAGGIPAGLGPESCLLKEAGEEASLPEALARQARHVARLSYVMRLPEGLRRDVLHVYDLELPEGFTPAPHDDEVERFELWPAERVLTAVRDTDGVKFNVNLVLIDLFLREGLIDPGSSLGVALRAGLDQGPR